jgi:hypothetical protein
MNRGTAAVAESRSLPAGLSCAGIAYALDYEAVRAAVDRYLRGHVMADPAEMRKAMWPTAQIEGVRHGQLVSWTVEEYCANVSGTLPPDEVVCTRTIHRIEVSGTAAMASATLVQGGLFFTDYFVLLKVDGVWKIANTVYTSRSTG